MTTSRHDDDLESLWRDHMAAQQRYRELIARLPSTPKDWLNASPEEQMEMLDTDELEVVMAEIMETWEAIQAIKVS
jgi:hypothetical protein